ncbi:uncharacterized protein LAESUDRAFT_731361 [Laetiporus sulphureus 93-53]|uniref:Uncharacterized protein n=1 Tax=Laetiporus sulphureus 93-53 TaxID=1314785 RepID=A0A165BLP2_9APHY|nr:uncharacterized protein LAESUDRAFT_731361 [Laetiporus sulphureus 93-53]KZT01278.1 hypothetical protein LAESUDRAFT_731361 [Laetiporus sulphureus 93-53]
MHWIVFGCATSDCFNGFMHVCVTTWAIRSMTSLEGACRCQSRAHEDPLAVECADPFPPDPALSPPACLGSLAQHSSLSLTVSCGLRIAHYLQHLDLIELRVY